MQKARNVFNAIVIALIMTGVGVGWVAARDVQSTPTAEGPEVTEVAPVPAQPTAEVTAEPPVIVVNPPPVDNGINWPDKLIEAGFALAVVFLALKQGTLLPPETVDGVLARFFELVKSVTAKTETPLDDTVVGITEDVVRKLVQQELAKQMASAVQAAKNSSLVG